MSEETLLEFPCQFPAKVMGTNSAHFENEMVMITRQYVPDLGEAAVQSKPSRTGKYLSVTITFTATSKAQIDNLYRALNAHPDVKMML
ncbi:MAG: YbeD family protein [Mariprofundus sp.]